MTSATSAAPKSQHAVAVTERRVTQALKAYTIARNEFVNNVKVGEVAAGDGGGRRSL